MLVTLNESIEQVGVINTPTLITAGSQLTVASRAQRLDYQQIHGVAAWGTVPSAWSFNVSFRQGNTTALVYSSTVNKTGGTNGGKVTDVSGSWYECLIINGDAADKTLNYCEFVGWR